MTSTERDIETTLHELADKGLRVVVAAGNRDTLGGLSYVQAISPARAGGYRSAITVNSIKGVVWTASAIKPSDEFWNFSAFGNFTRTALNTAGDGPPDFAEPGMDIVSLWPGKELAKCSGTSFAAAHLSGLLLTQEPSKLTRSNRDPSAEIPGFQNPKQYDTTRNDWIGVKIDRLSGKSPHVFSVPMSQQGPSQTLSRKPLDWPAAGSVDTILS